MRARAEIYLDSNAGAPLRPEVVTALLPLLQEGRASLFNPSSLHSHGRKAHRLASKSFEQITHSLGSKVNPGELVLTSSGTEANQMVIRSHLDAELKAGRSPHWITTPLEHDSNLQMVDWLEARGGTVSFLPVLTTGEIRVEAIEELWTPATQLVSLLWVNNETGVIADVGKAAALIRSRGGLLHLDGAQAWGKLEFDLGELGAQFVTFSGHKIGALAGTGLVWTSDKSQFAETLVRGKQQFGRRGGTENLLGLVALGAAAEALDVPDWSVRVARSRDALERDILRRIPGTQVNGAGLPRISNTLNLTFPDLPGDSLIMGLDLQGYSVSAGSACASGTREPSHVLLAMGRNRAQALASIRISLSEELPLEVIQGFVETLEKLVLAGMGQMNPAGVQRETRRNL